MNTANLAGAISTPETKKNYNRKLFTRIAHEYDTATSLMSLGGDANWKRELAKALPALNAPRCVDLASGTGDVAFELANRYHNAEIVGLDLTPAMIDVARNRCKHRGVRFEVADMCHTGLPDGWADIVTGSYALRNAPTLQDALHEVHRVLKPGGWAAFLDFSKSPNQFLQRIQIALLKVWGSFWGLVVHGRPEHAYIAESLRQFPDHTELMRQIQEAGFEITKTRSIYLGTLKLILLRRNP
jgi:ubiquinone/menaquinone biosynthesis methyltransferase